MILFNLTKHLSERLQQWHLWHLKVLVVLKRLARWLYEVHVFLLRMGQQVELRTLHNENLDTTKNV